MGEMFEHPPLAQEPVQHRLAIGLIAGPQDMVMGAGYDLNAVKLDKAKGADRVDRMWRADRRRRQAVRLKPEVARQRVRDFQCGQG